MRHASCARPTMTRPPSGEPSPRAHADATLEDVDAVREALVIGVCALISIAAVLAMVIVWRDDHKGLDR